MSGEQPADPYSHWRRRAETAETELARWTKGLHYVHITSRIAALEAENARLNMEMLAYREKLTPADAAAMVAVINALYAEKQTTPSDGEVKS